MLLQIRMCLEYGRHLSAFGRDCEKRTENISAQKATEDESVWYMKTAQRRGRSGIYSEERIHHCSDSDRGLPGQCGTEKVCSSAVQIFKLIAEKRFAQTSSEVDKA